MANTFHPIVCTLLQTEQSLAYLWGDYVFDGALQIAFKHMSFGDFPLPMSCQPNFGQRPALGCEELSIEHHGESLGGLSPNLT